MDEPIAFSFTSNDEVINFFNSETDRVLVPEWSIGLSFLEGTFDLLKFSRFKISGLWTVFDIEYNMLRPEANTLLFNTRTDKTHVTDMHLLNFGTKIGVMLPVMGASRFAIAPYYQFKPGIGLMLRNYVFADNPELSRANVDIERKLNNYTFGHEAGLRLFFWETTSITMFYSFGENSFASKVSKTTSDEEWIRKYDKKLVGVRIGF